MGNRVGEDANLSSKASIRFVAHSPIWGWLQDILRTVITPKLPADRQTELVKAAKHLLSMARAGRICALGFAVLEFDDIGDVVAGTNAVWHDDIQIREGLKDTVSLLYHRVAGTSAIKSMANGGIIIQ